MAQLPADDEYAVIDTVIDGLGQLLRRLVTVLYYVMLIVGWVYRVGSYVMV